MPQRAARCGVGAAAVLVLPFRSVDVQRSPNHWTPYRAGMIATHGALGFDARAVLDIVAVQC